MKALAAVTSTAPSHLNLPQPQAQPDEHAVSDRVDARAARTSRDVTLSPTRVEAGDGSSTQTQTRNTSERPTARDAVQDRAEVRGERADQRVDQLRESIKSGNERVAEGGADLPSPANTAVTYRVHPDLRTYQGQVVDRDSTEVVRSVPSEREIEFSRRYQDYIGRTLDMLA